MLTKEQRLIIQTEMLREIVKEVVRTLPDDERDALYEACFDIAVDLINKEKKNDGK